MPYTYSNSAPSANVTIGQYQGAGLYQITGKTTYSNLTYSYANVNNGVLTVNGGTGGSWGVTNTPGITVRGDAEFDGNVYINGQNLSATLKSIEQRLSILVPNPKLLDKYEALKQAYDHYKTLEALCFEENNSK